ncbi:MAG: redox-regulated ATPase YchF [Acidobacteriota bacterium]|jgi:GTP-binding protein YchF|nr:redox-regulated ATPase YchF [Acidobacteriota bacterium]
MKVGIVGLPQVGKTTIFSLLTEGRADASSWGNAREAHIGIAYVPDPKLDRLAEVVHPEKTTYATVEYVDLPGLATGEGKAALEGQSKDMSGYLNNLKNVDALLHVVRGFDDPNLPHIEGSVDPLRDIGLFELELIFSDLAIIEKRLERLVKDLKKVKSPELEQENELLLRFKAALEQEQPLREIELTPDEKKRVRGFTFLSAKPMLLVINIDDGDAAKIDTVVESFGLQKQASAPNVGITAVCGKIESEIASLDAQEAAAFMEDFNLPGNALARIINKSYDLLGVFSFYTAGEPEARAWTIPRGATAPQAAGAIHSDIEKGFIKAEVVSFDDMVALGTFPAAKSKGVLRLEGKEYKVREGDVILFRHNM